MKDSKKMDKDKEVVIFLEKLTDLAESLGCRGKIPGEPELPAVGDSLTLEQIAQLKVMMGNPELADLALKIGATPTERLLDLNDALKPVHGDKEHKEMKGLLSKYKKTDDQISQYEPENVAPNKKTKPRSTKK